MAIDLDQRLGQLVEYLAQLGLGADESIDGVLEVLPQSPRLGAGQHERGERDDTDAAGEQRAGDDGVRHLRWRQRASATPTPPPCPAANRRAAC